MAKSRVQFQLKLQEITSVNVYYQPPRNVQMKYPCIVYNLSDIDATSANNKHYVLTNGYMVTVIDKNPDSTIAKKLIESFPMSNLQSTFIQDNLHHWVIQIYY